MTKKDNSFFNKSKNLKKMIKCMKIVYCLDINLLNFVNNIDILSCTLCIQQYIFTVLIMYSIILFIPISV